MLLSMLRCQVCYVGMHVLLRGMLCLLCMLCCEEEKGEEEEGGRKEGVVGAKLLKTRTQQRRCWGNLSSSANVSLVGYHGCLDCQYKALLPLHQHLTYGMCLEWQF